MPEEGSFRRPKASLLGPPPSSMLSASKLPECMLHECSISGCYLTDLTVLKKVFGTGSGSLVIVRNAEDPSPLLSTIWNTLLSSVYFMGMQVYRLKVWEVLVSAGRYSSPQPTDSPGSKLSESPPVHVASSAVERSHATSQPVIAQVGQQQLPMISSPLVAIGGAAAAALPLSTSWAAPVVTKTPVIQQVNPPVTGSQLRPPPVITQELMPRKFARFFVSVIGQGYS